MKAYTIQDLAKVAQESKNIQVLEATIVLTDYLYALEDEQAEDDGSYYDKMGDYMEATDGMVEV